ncbi:NB-ARC domain-containing protein, partial [Bacteroidota bacterium]
EYSPGYPLENINASEPKNHIHNIPDYSTSFIGRQKEIENITEFIKSHRIISMVGAGGSGKTRLACVTVTKLEQVFEDGIWFVDLAPVETNEFLVKRIMESLNIPEFPGENLIDTLVNEIHEKKMLIILDNCEHLAMNCAEVADRLIKSIPGIKILTTSRVVLNIKGEKIWRIPSLSLLKPEKATDAVMAKESEALMLFTDRAHLSDPRFELVNENVRDLASICMRLDGIPLALELVASRTRYMEPSTMIERISERFLELASTNPGAIPRHKTLDATIDWSYKLLTDEEKIFFKRLSVFSGGFDLSAVQEVCGDESLPGEYIFDLLSNLVDRSMVITIRNPGQPMRYSMLEILRQYASGLIQGKEEHIIRKKHLEYFINLAEEANRERLNSQAFWMAKLLLEHENMISALHWSENQNLTKFTSLAGLLSWFWSRSNYYNLARRIFEKILTNGYARREAKARILAGYGWILTANADQYSSVIRQLLKSLTIWRRLYNKKEEALVLADLAFFYYGDGDDATGLKTAKKAYDIAQIEKDPGHLLYCMLPVSQGFVNLKKFDEAKAMAIKIIAAAEELKNLFAQFIGHHHYGDCMLMEGDFEEARRRYAKGIEITNSYGDTTYTCIDLTGLAMSVAGMGCSEKALRIVGSVKEIAKQAGIIVPEEMKMIFWQEQVKIHIIETREKLGVELSEKLESEGKAMDMDEIIKYALDFNRN